VLSTRSTIITEIKRLLMSCRIRKYLIEGDDVPISKINIVLFAMGFLRREHYG
jgi:hypothetical protein